VSHGLPWSKFYWRDYESDPALKACSHGAQALWVRLLCIAAQHDPPGYVAVANKPLDTPGVAKLTGWTVDEAQADIAELEKHGVFSRDKRRCIYSRRMVQDRIRRESAEKNGRKGGNPALISDRVKDGKHNGNGASDNHQDKARHKGGLKPSRARHPESRVQNPPYSPPASGGPAEFGGLGRLTLSSGAYIDHNGVYRITDEQRRQAERRAEESPDEPD
jgi:hypothetical protein